MSTQADLTGKVGWNKQEDKVRWIGRREIKKERESENGVAVTFCNEQKSEDSLAKNHAKRGEHVFITVTCSIVGHPGTVWTLHPVGGPDYKMILPYNLPQETLFVLPIISSIGNWRAGVVWKNGLWKLIFLLCIVATAERNDLCNLWCALKFRLNEFLYFSV